MSKFYNYLSALPNNTLNKIFIDNKRVIVPAKLNASDLYKACSSEINMAELGPEKALYIVLTAK